MARGIYSKTTAAITTNTTTNIIPAPAADETVYVSFISVDVTTAGAAWLATLQPTTTVAAFNSVFLMAAQGHQESYLAPSQSTGPRYPGFALPKGEGLQAVTTGTPGSATITVIYEIK